MMSSVETLDIEQPVSFGRSGFCRPSPFCGAQTTQYSTISQSDSVNFNTNRQNASGLKTGHVLL
jgi:hypothetical protein